MIRQTIHQTGVWAVRVMLVIGVCIAVVLNSKDDWVLYCAMIASFFWLDEDAPELVDEEENAE